MTKLVLQSTSLTLSPVSRSDLEPARRLIVLMPYFEADLIPATVIIWELANVMGARVQFIGLYSRAAQELGLKRQLITMSAMVNAGRVYTEAEVMFGKDWVDAVKSRLQDGDIVVCFAEQRIGLLRRPLSQVLQSDLNVPLYILSGLYPRNDPRSNWLAQIAAWTGSIAIIIGFFLLQVKIDQLTTDWTHIAFPLLSIPIELWMILAWNSLFE